MHEIRFSAGALLRTPLGELTTLPSPLIGCRKGNPLLIPHPPRRLRRLGFVVPANWGVSIFQGKWKALPRRKVFERLEEVEYYHIPHF